MYKCAVYTRVSTDDQNTSIVNQRGYFIDYIKSRGWILFDIYTDEAFTGTETTKRLSFQRLLSDAKEKKYNLLLAKSYSRFGRNQRETLDAIAKLLEHNVRIIFIEDNLDSKRDIGQFGLFGWLAEQEARKVSERIKIVWEHYNRTGKIHSCTSPYGYDYSTEFKNFIVNEDEAEVVKEIFKLYIDEGYGMTKIANNLRDRGIKTKKGGEWANATIRNIITNRVYIGDLVQGKSKNIDVTIKKRKQVDKKDWIIHQDNHEAIISQEMFYRTQEVLKNRSRKHGHNRHSNKALFSNLIECPYCGSSFTIKRQKHFKNYSPYYSCIAYELKGAREAGHSRVAIYEEVLLEGIKKFFERLKQNNFELLKVMIEKDMEKETKSDDLKKELKRVINRINDHTDLSMNLLKSYTKGILGETQFKLQNEQIEEELNILTNKKENLLEQIEISKFKKADKDVLTETINKLLFVENWNNVMLKEAIEKIHVYHTGRINVKLRFNPIKL